MYRTLLLLQQQAILLSFIEKIAVFRSLSPFSAAWFLTIKSERQNL